MATRCDKPFPAGLAALLTVAALLLAPDSRAEVLSVKLDARQRLTVDAEDVRLSRLLREIARQAGLELRLDPALDRRTTLAARNQTLDEFFNGLARRDRLNVMLGWGKPVGGVRPLTAVYVLKEGQTDLARLPPAETLAPGERKALKAAQQAERREARRAERGRQAGRKEGAGKAARNGKAAKADQKKEQQAPAAKAPATRTPAKVPASTPATPPATGVRSH